MDLPLVAAYVVHVVSAAFWTGAVLYVAAAVYPAGRDGRLSAGAFGDALHRLLLVTRWTGLALPATGAYVAWRRYGVEALLSSPRGHLVLAMAATWGVLNTLLEVGCYRVLAVEHGVGFGTYMREGLTARGGVAAGAVADLAAVARPYLLAGAALATLLLVDAALLAGGV
jgi:hypothetical protein